MNTHANVSAIPDDLIDITKAAQKMGVHVATLHRWRMSGKLPAYKLVGRWRVSVADLEAMFKPFDAKAPCPVTRPRAQTAAHRRAVANLERSGY